VDQFNGIHIITVHTASYAFLLLKRTFLLHKEYFYLDKLRFNFDVSGMRHLKKLNSIMKVIYCFFHGLWVNFLLRHIQVLGDITKGIRPKLLQCCGKV